MTRALAAKFTNENCDIYIFFFFFIASYSQLSTCCTVKNFRFLTLYPEMCFALYFSLFEDFKFHFFKFCLRYGMLILYFYWFKYAYSILTSEPMLHPKKFRCLNLCPELFFVIFFSFFGDFKYNFLEFCFSLRYGMLILYFYWFKYAYSIHTTEPMLHTLKKSSSS